MCDGGVEGGEGVKNGTLMTRIPAGARICANLFRWLED